MRRPTTRIDYPTIAVCERAEEVILEIFDKAPWRLAVRLRMPHGDAAIVAEAMRVAAAQGKEAEAYVRDLPGAK